MKTRTPESQPNAAEMFETYKDHIIMIKNEETGKEEPWKVTGASTSPEKAVVLHFNGESGVTIAPQTMLLEDFLKLPRKLPK